MIYTGYFGAIKKYPKDIEIVSIALYTPKAISVPHIWWLAPTQQILNMWKNGFIDEREYIKRYKADVLDYIDPVAAARCLDNKILCCFEKPTDFCHRKIVASWINSSLERQMCKEMEV